MNNKKLWYPAAMVIALSVAFGTAQAKSLEQAGAAEGQAEPLKTYGVDVSAKSGLKTLLPTGWNLFIYKNTNLPQSISWTVGDTWIGALEKFADKNDLAVRLDWAKKAVYVSSPEVAIEARAKLAEIDNASRTPLPAYTPAVAKSAPVAAPVAVPVAVAAVPGAESRVSSDLLARALAATAPKSTPASAPVASAPAAAPAAAPVVAMPAVAAVATVPAAGTTAPVRLAPPVGPRAAAVMPAVAPPAAPIVVAAAPAAAPAPVATPAPAPFAALQSQAPAVRPYVAPRPAPAQVAQAPVAGSDAFAHANMEDVVRKTADKLGYQVSWETITLPLEGPVTFLGVDAAEDMRLLQKSLGMRRSPISIEVYRGSSVIRVTAASPGKEPLSVYDSSYSGLIGYGQRTASASLSSPSDSVSVNYAAPQGAFPTVSAAPARAATPASPAAQPVVATQAPPPAPAPVVLSLHIAKGESLSKAIAQFLKAQGWELKWQVPNDMEADFPFDANGETIAQVLNTLLPKLGLDTDMYSPSKMVVVRPIDNTAE